MHISRKLHHPDQLGKDSFCGWSPNILQHHSLKEEVVSSSHWHTDYMERGLKADIRAKDCKISVQPGLKELDWCEFKSTMLILSKPLPHFKASVSPAVTHTSHSAVMINEVQAGQGMSHRARIRVILGAGWLLFWEKKCRVRQEVSQLIHCRNVPSSHLKPVE